MWVSSGRSLLWGFLVSLVLFQSVFAASCKSGCPTPNKSTKYSFKPGTVYSYDVDSFVQIQQADKAADKQTTLKVEGKVELYAGDNCQYTLKVVSLTSFAPDGKKTAFGAEISKPVRFTLSNDELLPEICTEADDTDFSVNVKRGLISLFQSAQEKSTETDVFGVCQTSFSSYTADGATVVDKSRDLSNCAYRESLSNSFVTRIVNSKAGIKTTPLLQSFYNNQQTFKDGLLNSVKLGEEYQYLPYLKDKVGVTAKVTTKLTLKGSKAGAAPAAGNEPRSIIFENPDQQPTSNLANIKQELRQTVESYTNGNVGKKTANLFVELIQLMRYSKKEDLLALYNQVKAGSVHSNKDLTRKVYLDSLFRVGTGDAVEAITQLYKNKEITDAQEVKLAFVSLNLVDSMTHSALKAVNKLLEGNPPREAYLSVGSLVSKYCQKHGCQSADVKEISNKFASKLGKCQAGTRSQEDVLVAVLKGVRNSNNLVAPLLDKVVQCTGPEASSRVRVAALQALPAASCNKKVVNSALATLKNTNEDSEIRIHAYLSLVECPSANVANEFKTLLDSEKVYQVGSFITSHLASLRSSVDPTREAARQHFGKIRTSNKFPFDVRRYSFNRELSYAVESLGVGASADTSVIFSQKSFLPKSVAVNFTAEVFGNGVNVFELEGRQDNLERLVEHYFGPKGFFTGMDLQTAYDTLFQQYQKMSESAKARFRRGIREDVRALARNVNLHNDALQDFNFDLTVKVFGSELFFLSTGENLPTNPEQFLEKALELFDKLVEGAKKFERTFEHHALFLDTDLVYTTAVGLPLKLSAQGAAVARLDAAVEVDLKALVQDYTNAKFNVKLQPSGSFEVTGTLSVDAFNVLTGMQVAASGHSSAGAAVKFALHGATAYDLTVDSLQTKQELVSVTFREVIITRERGNPLIVLPAKRNDAGTKFSECFDNLYNVIGVTVCAAHKVQGQEEVFEAYLEVEPKFQFSGKFDNSNPRHVTLQMSFDTPGTQTKRATSLLLEGVTGGDLYVKATLDSPFRKLDFQLGANYNDKEVALYALAHNGMEEYLAKVGFERGSKGGREEYVPIFTIRSPSGDAQVSKLVQTTGKIVVETLGGDKRKYLLQNIEWNSPYAPKTTINGHVVSNGERSYDADVDVTVGDTKNNVLGHLDFDLKHVKLDLEKKTPSDANKNFKVNLELAYTENSFKNLFSFASGKDFNNPSNKYELSQLAEFTLKPEAKGLESLKLYNKLQLPKQLVRLDFATNKNKFFLDGEYGYDKYKIAANVDAKYNEKSAGDYDVQVGASLNKHFFKVFSKRVVEQNKSRFSNRLTASTGTKLELNGAVTNRFSTQDGELNLDGTLVAVEKASPYKLSLTVQFSAANVVSNAKVLVDKAEFATYDFKLERGNDPNGKFSFVVKDFFDGNGELKSTKGQGELFAVVNFQKQDRKVKLDTKFKVSAPVYDVSVDLYYDFEKDNSKKVHFETKNKATQTSFDSKNKVEVFSEKYEFNVQGQGNPKPVDGTFTTKFNLVLPTGRQFGGDFKRDVSTKDEKKFGKMVANVFDKQPGGKQRTVAYTGELKDGNFKAKLFDATHNVKYTDLDGKTLLLDVGLKHVPAGSYRSAAGSLKVSGSLLPQVAEVAVVVDEYCEHHAKYHVDSKYGADFGLNLVGGYHTGGHGKPASHELKVDVTAPSVKLGAVSNGKYLQPETDDGVYDFEYNGSLDYNGQKASVATQAKGNFNRGNGKLNLNFPNVDPIAAEGSYTYDGKEDGPFSANGALKVAYGQGKNFEFTGSAKAPSSDDVQVHVTLKSDFENVRSVDVTFKHAKSAVSAYNTKLQVTADGKKFSVENAVVLSESNPSVDFTLAYPDKTVKVSGSYKTLGHSAFKADAKVQNLANFDMEANVEANFDSYQTFYFKLYGDAPMLKTNKFSVEVNAKPGSNGKGVNFRASEGGKDILSGYADYSVKEQGKATVIEGQGNVKLYDKQQTATFKLVREKLADSGFSGSLTASVGKISATHEVRVQPNDFRLKTSVCDEKKKCTKLEILSKLERNAGAFNHEALVSVEVQQYEHEFGLSAKTSANGFKFDHTTDVQLKEKNQPKYQYLFYVHPTSAGASLILPTRTIAVEGLLTLPKEKFGLFDGSVSVYLDKKNEPNNKATFAMRGETKMLGSAGVSADGALTFSHPTIKGLAIRAKGSLDGDKQTADGSVEFDVFKKAADKLVASVRYANSDLSYKGFNITTDASVSSKGLGLNCGFNGHYALSLANRQASAAGSLTLPFQGYTFGSYFFGSPEAFDFLLTRFGDDFVRAHGSYDAKKYRGDFTSTFKFVPNRPVVFESQLNGLSSAKFSFKQDQFFSADGTFGVDKAVVLNVVGEGKPLLNAKVTLDASHFLSTEYKVDEANAKLFLQSLNKQLQADFAVVKDDVTQRYGKLTQDVSTLSSKVVDALPDFGKFQQSYAAQLQKLQQDVMSDPTLAEFVNQVAKVFQALSEVFGQLSQVYIETLRKVTAIVTDVFGQLMETFNTKVLPALQELSTKVEAIFFNIYEETVKLLMAVFERTVKALKVFEEDFNKIANNVSELFKTFAQTFSKAVQVLEKELKDLYKLVQEYFESFDEFKVVKEMFQEYFDGADRYAYQLLRELLTLVEALYPVPEVQELTTAINQYVSNKLENKPVNDVEELKKLFVSFVKVLHQAVERLISNVNLQLAEPTLGSESFTSFFTFKFLPYVSSVQFSPWNFFKNEKFYSVRDLIHQLRLYAFNPFANVPLFHMHGQLADGGHFFTFDDKHFTFPGSCSYLLASDFVDGNFSIVADMDKGRLKSVTLVDKDSTVELTSKAVVKYNGKESDLPLYQKDVYVFRRYYTVTVGTKYGAQVMCTTDLKLCHFFVSGFYLGRLRGLLGNGNYEPYDDLALPDGKITTVSTDFANTYKTSQACAAVADHGHDSHEHSNPTCAKFFGSESSLKMCSYLRDQTGYKEACNHAAHDAGEKADEAACGIARLYVSGCRLYGIPTALPSQCEKCVGDGGNQVDVGDWFSVKAPQKKADVVFVVDTALGTLLGELVQATINDLRKELKATGVTDVNIAVIGYSKTNKYTSLFSNGGKLDYTGKLGQVDVSSGPKQCKALVTGFPDVDAILEQLHVAGEVAKENLGTTTEVYALRRAFTYPFRATASKSVLLFRSEAFEDARPGTAISAALGLANVKARGILFNIVAPLKNVGLSNTKDQSKVKSIVGFNERVVYHTNDKKRTVGSAEMKKSLKYDDVVGVTGVERAGGNFFVLQNYSQQKAGKEKKQFISIVAAVLADQFSRTETTNDCVCYLRSGLHPETVCSASDVQLLPPSKKAGGAKG
ncbi:apolipophorins [Anopheles ziemanni]|uniref:apolipophorins n=1 Tax=Anopheles coustani TaxID=139045 RepID=UPI00265B37C9|nr:apolipophorins [Anopheles coustani]XP_058168804.1 apolipophorins [Anopheles ziemanni]